MSRNRSEAMILNRLKEEEKIQKGIQFRKDNRLCEDRCRFEIVLDLKIKTNHILQRFEQLKLEQSMHLEERRDKLRHLFKREQAQYEQQVIAKEETVQERVQRMKERVAELKEKHEQERQQVAQEKLMQRWRNECDELRQVLAKHNEKQVKAVRDKQMIELKDKKEKIIQENEYYAKLWEQDRLRKVEREEQDKQRLKQLNIKTFEALKQQLQLIYERELEQAKLKKEQGELMKQQNELIRLEELRCEEQKRQEQKQRRLELDKINQENLYVKMKEMQKSLELDRQIMEAFLKEGQLEKDRVSQKRKELRDEMNDYREHLKMFKQMEKEREKEMERIYRQQEEQEWRMRLERWRKEQQARDRLMQQVLKERKQQLKEQLERNQREQQEAEKERLELLQKVDEYQREQQARQVQEKQKEIKYQSALLGQMKETEHFKELEQQQLEREVEQAAQLRREFEALLEREKQRILNDAKQ